MKSSLSFTRAFFFPCNDCMLIILFSVLELFFTVINKVMPVISSPWSLRPILCFNDYFLKAYWQHTTSKQSGQLVAAWVTACRWEKHGSRAFPGTNTTGLLQLLATACETLARHLRDSAHPFPRLDKFAAFNSCNLQKVPKLDNAISPWHQWWNWSHLLKTLIRRTGTVLCRYITTI